MSGFYTELMKGIGASKRVFGLLERSPSIPTKGGFKPASINGHILFEGVHFTYPMRTDVPVRLFHFYSCTKKT